jgi:NodT family efflux transporter outer membrane factor (OMF) lipoprotein
MRRYLKIVLTCFGLSACSMAPKHLPIKMNLPKEFKELKYLKPARPHLYEEKKDKWWRLYHDDTLSALAQELNCHNQQLKIAYAQYQEAKNAAKAARAFLYPNLTGLYNMARTETSHTLVAGKTSTGDELLFNTFLLAGLVNYEIDFWGKIRSAVKANEALERATAFDRAALSMSLHAQLASDYFGLRSADRVHAVLEKNKHLYQQMLALIEKKFQIGVVDQDAVERARAQLAEVSILIQENQVKRGQFEHSIAVLIGQMPSTFHIKPHANPYRLVTPAPHLPSRLLERRPDIVAAQMRVKSAAANIGVVKAAFFPVVSLFGTLGAQSGELSRLFSANSLYWSLGPSAGTTVVSLVKPMVTWTVFNGFKLQADLSKAWATLRATSAAYRQTVLQSFREVEDALLELYRTDKALDAQKTALKSATIQYQQALIRLNKGVYSYLDVAPVEVQYHQAQIAIIALETRRQIVSVNLIKALGGSW